MTTLLDLKSSVLRQVQRSQSLRSRREPPPTASSPLAHSPDPLPRSQRAAATGHHLLSTECLNVVGIYSTVVTCCEQTMYKLSVPQGHIHFTIMCRVRL